jgi:sugar phosphate permease
MPKSTDQASKPSAFDDFKISNGYRWYVIWLLFAVYVLNFVDRQILTILVEPIRKDFNFTDTQMGLLGGFAFAVVYSILGIPIARIADRKNRVTIISIALFVWSFFTVLTGRAQTFARRPRRGRCRRSRMHATRLLHHR